MKAFGYMTMLASQDVMDAFDRRIDHLLPVSSGTSAYDWTKVHALALAFMNELREDVGINKNPISYNGAV